MGKENKTKTIGLSKSAYEALNLLKIRLSAEKEKTLTFSEVIMLIFKEPMDLQKKMEAKI